VPAFVGCISGGKKADSALNADIGSGVGNFVLQKVLSVSSMCGEQSDRHGVRSPWREKTQTPSITPPFLVKSSGNVGFDMLRTLLLRKVNEEQVVLVK
jgi:hypothetical protein